jgi:hypothetical protein
MKIEKRTVKINEYITETRYFAETEDGFDGTAQGYGYKSLEKLHKAYWFFKNRNRLNDLKAEAKKFLKENPDVTKIIREFFSMENLLDAAKNRETLTFTDLLISLKKCDLSNKEEIITKIGSKKHLWRTLLMELG